MKSEQSAFFNEALLELGLSGHECLIKIQLKPLHLNVGFPLSPLRNKTGSQTGAFQYNQYMPEMLFSLICNTGLEIRRNYINRVFDLQADTLFLPQNYQRAADK